MEEKKDVFKVLFIVFLILFLISGGFIVYDKFLKPETVIEESNTNNTDNSNIDTNDKDNNNIDNNDNNNDNKEYTFADFAKILEKNNIQETINTYDHYNAIIGIYFEKGKVYALFKDEADLKGMNLPESDIEKIKKLKLDRRGLYQLPLEDIVLVSTFNTSSGITMLFETKDGKVYSFIGDQTGQSNYPLFNEKGEINIVEEVKLKNIVRFGTYSFNDVIGIYGIDINGNIIKQYE